MDPSHPDAPRLLHLGELVARLCAGGVHPAEQITIDGPGRAISLHDGNGRRLVRLDLDDPTWFVDSEGRIAWR